MANELISIDSPLEKGFILQVTVHISPDKVDEFLSLFKPVYDIVAAEKECVFFVVGRRMPSPLEPDQVQDSVALSWTEGWSESVDWFMNVQFKKEYYGPYLKATEAMFAKPREMQILAPQPGMNNFKAQ